LHGRLQRMQVIRGALRMRGGGEDQPLVVLQGFQARGTARLFLLPVGETGVCKRQWASQGPEMQRN